MPGVDCEVIVRALSGGIDGASEVVVWDRPAERAPPNIF